MMKVNKIFVIGLTIFLGITAHQANAKTYCGALGQYQVQLDSLYFTMKPDYEGTSAWESNNFQPKEDCTSKLTLLSVHTNINTGEPSKAFSEKPFDIVLSFEPAKDNLFLERYSKTLEQNKSNMLVSSTIDKKVLETTHNRYGGFERTVIYLDNSHVTEITKCTFNTTTKRNICELLFEHDNFHVSMYGSFESLRKFDKARSFSIYFLQKSRINK